MRVLQTNFHGDPNLGLFGRACDRYCLIGSFVPEKNIKKLSDLLDVKIIDITVASTDLVGIFCGINSNGIVLPKIINGLELNKFKAIKKELGINLEVIKSKFTALGNLILCNDKGAVISKLFSKRDKKMIEDCLCVSSEYTTIAGINNLGSSGIATNLGCLVHRDAREEEITTIESMLKVEVGIGTANFGSPFVGSCVIANGNGAAIGESSTGPEANRIMEALRYF